VPVVSAQPETQVHVLHHHLQQLVTSLQLPETPRSLARLVHLGVVLEACTAITRAAMVVQVVAVVLQAELAAAQLQQVQTILEI
jgi:hypothetical protein